MSGPAQIMERAAVIGEQAVTLEGLARDAFIKAACQDDEELTKAVRKYIARPRQALRSTVSTVLATADSRQKVRRSPIRVLQNRYELNRYLGAGGMGQVFKAVDHTTGKAVAIKLIKAEAAFVEDRRMRFVREARSAGGLRHPSIVEVYDIGQVEGNLYMVMEYLEGVPLRTLISNRRQVALSSMMQIMSQVTDALAFAHSKGVIHGDIKPENIMVLRDGSAKLVDFGLAQQIGSRNSLVEGGGTIAYMAPERFEGKAADEASNIWSAGLTLFECVMGQSPFRTITDIVSSPTPFVKGDSPLSGALNRLFAHALAKNPGERFRSMKQFADDVASVCDIYSHAAKNPEVHPSPVAKTRNATTPADGRPLSADNSYALPELGFIRPPEGTIEVKASIFRWIGRRRSVQVFQDIAPWALLGAVVLLMHLSMYTSFSVFTPRGIYVVVSIALGILLLFAPTTVCLIADAFTQLPVCRSCHSSMKRTSQWARFVKTREEFLLGPCDCISALKHGLWHDAAKLLSIYGRELIAGHGNQLLTPARFQLSFFECDACCDHAARLTTEERTGNSWNQQERYYEAYWRSSNGNRPFFLRFANGFNGVLRSVMEARCHFKLNFRWLSRPLIACAFLAALVIITGLWSRRNERIRFMYELKRHEVCYAPPKNVTPEHLGPMRHVELPANKDVRDFLRDFECYQSYNRYLDCHTFCIARR
ncbi:MAG: serine/threonine protein kinase [Acidobacteriaceae bacterium]|nr:serine/threonine protein kinase [Acidobacteriaceae bacterium]MBV9766041.1 serine/threonine protein kinase [Acidobacteriaceae bacterium]